MRGTHSTRSLSESEVYLLNCSNMLTLMAINHHYGLLTFEGEIEAAEPVTAQRIGSALKHNCARLVHLHHFRHHWLEDLLIRLIIDTVSEWEVHSIVFPFTYKASVTVRYIRSPTELSWPWPWRGQTVRYIHSPTEL